MPGGRAVTGFARRGLGGLVVAAAWLGPALLLVARAHRQQWPVPEGDPWTTWLLPWTLRAWSTGTTVLAVAWLAGLPLSPHRGRALLRVALGPAATAWALVLIAGLPFCVWTMRLGVGADALVPALYAEAALRLAAGLALSGLVRALAPGGVAFGAGALAAAWGWA